MKKLSAIFLCILFCLTLISCKSEKETFVFDDLKIEVKMQVGENVRATLPYSIEAMIIGFASPWIGGSMATYGIGFKLIVAVSYIVYFDIAFFIYSVITLFIRAKRNPLRW